MSAIRTEAELITEGTKVCSKCFLPQPITEFQYKKKNNKHRIGLKISAMCKTCDGKRAYQYHKKSRELNGRSDKADFSQFNTRYSHSKSISKVRGRSWDLTKDQYRVLIDLPCYYCRLPITIIGVGLDRINNALGYSIDNVVPCCGDCNTARMDNFTSAEMIVIGAAIRQVKLTRLQAT